MLPFLPFCLEREMEWLLHLWYQRGCEQVHDYGRQTVCRMFFFFFFLFFPLRFNRRRRNNTNTSVLCKTTVTNCVQVPGWFEFTLHGKQLCLSKVQLLASELMIGAVKERKKKNPMWANNWQNLEASAFFYFLFLTVIIWTWLLTPSSLQS